MHYFEDFQLLNITNVRMYGSTALQLIDTHCHYLGLMQGQVYVNKELVDKPFIYFTPRNILTANGWQSPEGCWRDNFYLECSGARADRLFAAFEAVDSPRYYTVSNVAAFAAIFKTLQRLFKQNNLLNNSRCVLLVEELACLLENELLQQKGSNHERYNIAETIQKISQHPAADWNIQQLSAQCGITLRHWNRLFAEASGMAPHRFIMQCRMRLARELLSNSNLSIKEIAAECGWSNESDFCRFFRKNSGTTPGGFRRQQLR